MTFSVELMKEFDETPVPEYESEDFELMRLRLTHTLSKFRARIRALEMDSKVLKIRLANLETQRTPDDNNMDDPEWY